MRWIVLAALMLTALTSIGICAVILGSGPSADPGHAVSDLDLDGDGQAELEAYSNGSAAGIRTAPGSSLQFATDVLGPGAIIDDSLTFNPSGGGVFATTTFGNAGSANETRGFRFTSDGATHYGWATLTAHADYYGGTFPVATAMVLQWAYESEPNTPIAIGAVPEPASAAVLLGIAPLIIRHRRSR